MNITLKWFSLIIFLALFASSINAASCQDFSKKDLKEVRLLHLTIDNDSFLFSQTDWYYSSGIYARYGTLVDPADVFFHLFPKKENKVIRTYGLTHQVYTPVLFNSPFVSLYDRPHAALLQFDYGLSYASAKNILKLRGSLGWMGSALGTGPMLTWFHDVLNYKTPRGWEYEIGNTPVVQLKANWYRTLVSDRLIDWTLTSQGEIGTVFANSSIGSELRVGKLLGIDNSLLFDQFSGVPDSKGVVELFFIVGGNINYSFYNATIEGPVLGGESPHTENPMKWIKNGHFGAGLGGNRLDAMLMLNYRSPTTSEAGRHKYISIKLNYRL
ncbi:MAG: DUF2219 family protein [Cyclobacteriaceae bacterium]